MDGICGEEMLDLNLRQMIWRFGPRWDSEELIRSSGQFLDNRLELLETRRALRSIWR